MNAKTFYNVFGVNGSKSDIPETNATLVNLSQGFTDIYTRPLPSGGKAPDREEFNGIFYLIFSHLYNVQTGKCPDYDSQLVYDKNCVVRCADGYQYTCLQNNGPGTAAGIRDPMSADNSAYWYGGQGTTVPDVLNMINEAKETLIENIEILNLHIANESNPHKVDKYDVGLSNIPNMKSDAIDLDDSETLATSRAVYDLNFQLELVKNNITELFEMVAVNAPTISVSPPTPLTQEEIDEGVTLVDGTQWIQIILS